MHTFSGQKLTSCTLFLNLVHTFPEAEHTFFAPFAHFQSCCRIPGSARALHPPALLGKQIRAFALFFGIRASVGAHSVRQPHARRTMQSVAARYTRDPLRCSTGVEVTRPPFRLGLPKPQGANGGEDARTATARRRGWRRRYAHQKEQVSAMMICMTETIANA